MSASMKLRVCVETKIWSSSVTMRPTLFDVSTVSFIASLIFTTPCGVCSRQFISVSKASRSMTVSWGSHLVMVQWMLGSFCPYSSRSHSFMLASCSFTNSDASPDGTQIVMSAVEAMEALASPMWRSATSKSYSLYTAANRAHAGTTALQRPLLISTPEWPPSPPSKRMWNQRCLPAGAGTRFMGMWWNCRQAPAAPVVMVS